MSPRRSRVRRRACSGPGAAETRINAVAATRRKDWRICIVEDIVTSRRVSGSWNENGDEVRFAYSVGVVVLVRYRLKIFGG